MSRLRLVAGKNWYAAEILVLVKILEEIYAILLVAGKRGFSDAARSLTPRRIQQLDSKISG